MTVRTAHASLEIDAPIARVWRLVRDFGAISAWHPLVRSSTIDDDGQTRPGVIRTMTMSDGAVVEERLIQFSDADARLAYEWVGTPPVPVSESVVRVRVESISADRSRVSMNGEFGGEVHAVELAVQASENMVWPAALHGLAAALAGGA
jgi:uncharacterized protein YndB with AHSA1/START domain